MHVPTSRARIKALSKVEGTTQSGGEVGDGVRPSDRPKDRLLRYATQAR